MNRDGIDEIVYTKFIPSLIHDAPLGIIEYTLKVKNGKYVLGKEALRDKVLGILNDIYLILNFPKTFLPSVSYSVISLTFLLAFCISKASIHHYLPPYL